MDGKGAQCQKIFIKDDFSESEASKKFVQVFMSLIRTTSQKDQAENRTPPYLGKVGIRGQNFGPPSSHFRARRRPPKKNP